MIVHDQALYQIYAWPGDPRDRPSGCAVAYLVIPSGRFVDVYLYAMAAYGHIMKERRLSVFYHSVAGLLTAGYTRYTGDPALTDLYGPNHRLAVLEPAMLGGLCHARR